MTGKSQLGHFLVEQGLAQPAPTDRINGRSARFVIVDELEPHETLKREPDK